MKLDVSQTESTWYSTGLHFTCTQCGNCCTGGPGYVWITEEEIAKLAAELKLSVPETMRKFCRKIGERYSLKEHRNSAGLYDCVFLKEIPAEPAADGQIPLPKRVCTIYNARPLQCRTWPFWAGNLASPESWTRAGDRCPGLNNGRKFTKKQIEAVRDSASWPKDPPSSL